MANLQVLCKEPSWGLRHRIVDLIALYFTWDPTSGITDYVLQVGTSSGSYNVFNDSVGNITSYLLNLPNGTYYWKVVPYTDATPESYGSELVVVL